MKIIILLLAFPVICLSTALLWLAGKLLTLHSYMMSRATPPPDEPETLFVGSISGEREQD